MRWIECSINMLYIIILYINLQYCLTLGEGGWEYVSTVRAIVKYTIEISLIVSDISQYIIYFLLALFILNLYTFAQSFYLYIILMKVQF